ncbi:MAG: nucleoside transporter C-terminal domain-containing protein [Bacteroidota bacterium]
MMMNNLPELLKPIFGDQYSFLFMFKIMPTIIFVAVLVNIAYHVGIMQIIVSFIARIVHALMRVSGSEALSNVASAFVGQVEAQIMIKPYIASMTMSELLASMSGSMACIAGGVMAVYISMGVPAPYLLAASIMAAPASLVIAKIMWPETEESATKGAVKLEVKKVHANLLDAISHGAGDGLKVSLNVIAMLIGFIALIALINAILAKFGLLLATSGLDISSIGIDLNNLSLNSIFGSVFSIFAWAMGVPLQDTFTVGSLMGTKMVINEFVAYSNLSPMIVHHTLQPKSLVIVSFALCGFANFSSIAIQVGGIGELAPSRRSDLAKLGFRALFCGTLASYLSATIAGILM